MKVTKPATARRSLDKSREMFDALSAVMAGGVGSADRALVAPHPIFIARGEGSRMWDVDGNEYIDYLLGYGPLVLGHANPRLVDAIDAQMRRGSIFGASHPLELAAAEQLTSLMPSMEQVRFGQSGTEAVQSAIRLARAATGRSLVVKFEGHYHGWADQVAVSYAPAQEEAGPDSAPSVVPMSAGQAYGTFQDVLVLGWNDRQAVQDVFASRGCDIAAVLTEPIACNMGVVEPDPGFLQGLRDLCDSHGAILIFDEVQTGVRVGLHGAQGLCGIAADLTCLGKAISGGFPVSVLGGRRDLMALVGDRRVFQAGTYNTNPLCLAAILATLDRLSEPGTYEQMAASSQRLRIGLAEIVEPVGGYVQGTTTLFGLGFGPGPIRTMRDGWRNDTAKMMEFKRALWSVGLYTKPTPRDIWYLSTEHTAEDIDITLERAAIAVTLTSP
ncbi:MAG TPA: glutamate-1-semialdehyde 2,1-aminomutase [Streptosporangiaceae bacterium]|nr:glutamate-1-semialdehyde 2,1-aminomutase [Streptosporangiaceae bacterium]